jgi:hypothetical protein
VLPSRQASFAGSRWHINLLASTESLIVFGWLAELIGEPIGRIGVKGALAGAKSALAKAPEGSKIVAPDAALIEMLADGGEAVAGAIGKLTRSFNQPATRECIKILLASLHENDRPIDYEDQFAGRFEVLMTVVFWALRENYQNFFLANPILRLLAPALETSPASNGQSPPQDSTGASGASSSPSQRRRH